MHGPDAALPSPVGEVQLAEAVNHTHFPSQYYPIMDQEDEVFHVMVSRLSYDLRRLDAEGYPQELEEQTPLCESDEYYDELPYSSVLQESDFAPYKPKCDLLFLHAHAWVPPGADGRRRLQPRIAAGVRLEFNDGRQWQKLLAATGPRMLRVGLLGGMTLDDPQPVESVPIRYEHAFGGRCQWWKGWPQPQQDEDRLELDLAVAANPIGCGYVDAQWQKKTGLTLFPAPQLEAWEEPFTLAHAQRAAQGVSGRPVYPVVGLGAVGRWWWPRLDFAGCFDARWKALRWPRLPREFDFRYWQAAPEDQQFEWLEGGEKLMLANVLGPEAQGDRGDGTMWFRLPRQPMRLLVRLHSGVMLMLPMRIDTVLVDLAAQRLTLVRRGVVSARAEVRKLELGLWSDDHQFAWDPEQEPAEED